MILAAACGCASYWDIRGRIVPNAVTVAAAAAGVFLAGDQWRPALMDAGMGLLLFLPVVLAGLAGMGDAKLCAAASALVGFPAAGLGAWLGTVICAVWIAAGEARRRRLGAWLFGHVTALAQLNAGRGAEGRTIPFAPFFTAGMALALAWRWWGW